MSKPSARLYDALDSALQDSTDEQRQAIQNDPGTSARVVGDRVTFEAAGITYLILERSWFGPDVEWDEFNEAHRTERGL
ncbi:hypothetical protein E5720_03955 [Rhodococcus sp. PAMC28707]|uniref:hypothetical protein n=1 Tax=unclassified Rhodococcus (in: high G+C Gram-positive bacteria) TaxID=192944 RepID=UPI00109E1CFB|nr:MULTISPECIES: hypothetical protein [unclassified Rhodococcus (in: high G+C Gram-positive bacteria)]QCB50542.1 hypothetical protein E5769_10060 [Rhodococcus sp. PAMC28705]QCB57766.1 hypothetical protein E5720_03955 [Rhodococcus sp. PAMC28707]